MSARDRLFQRDDRAQAIGILRLFLSLGVGAVVIWIVTIVTDPLFDHAGSSANDQVSNQGTQWLQDGVGFIPILFLGIAFFGLIAYSVYRRSGGAA